MTSLRALTAGRSPDEPVFRNRRRMPVTRFVVHATVARLTEAGVTCPSLAKKSISPHVIRHTTATHLLRAGVDINAIRAWLGTSRRHDQRICRSGSGDEGPNAGRVRIVHIRQRAHTPLAGRSISAAVPPQPVRVCWLTYRKLRGRRAVCRLPALVSGRSLKL